MTTIEDIEDYNLLMGLEGTVAKCFFSTYFQDFNWKGRHPRMKSDTLNVTLDIGYTILFNYMESFMRMFGFDLYKGVYHRLWYQRKSLICDIMEPFRCIIDHTILLAFHRGQFKDKDFIKLKGEIHFKYEKSSVYYNVFFKVLIDYKTEIFKYVQQYYRCFMGRKSAQQFPIFVYQ